jgi:hypothetical protein
VSARFLIDGARVRQLAATRQGRVSLGGFAYQMGYAVARLASLYTRRPVLEIDGYPTFLRFDWAEDLDEVEADGRVVLTQCKRIADIGQAGALADVLLGFAPKWLWTPEDRRPDLRFRLVCTDPRFAGLGPTSLRLYRPGPKESYRDAVLGAAVAQLQVSPGSKLDRALWQPEAEALGFSRLCEALWDQTEVLYLPAETLADDPAGLLFRAERDALALLVRIQFVAAGQQRPALAALRTLLHANIVEFDPSGTRPVPTLDREPKILGSDDVHYALFDFQPSSEERPPFQVVTRQVLENEAAKPKQPFVARRPRWSDVVYGQNEETRFLEREITDQVLAAVRDELLGKIGVGEALPMLFVLGAPGAGKSTLVLRVAARLVQEGIVVVAAPKLNLDSIEEDEVEPFLQGLAHLEEGSLPVLLVLDDPFFAESGWVDLLRRLGKKSRRVAVLGASPEYLYREFGYALTTGRQVDCRTLLLPRPLKIERRALAELHGRDPEEFAERDEDFLVLVMEASAGVSFDTIIDRIWITLNHGLPIDPGLHPEDLPWAVRAYLVACYFHRFYLRCPELLMRAILSHAGRDQPVDRIQYELQRLFDEHGWAIFGLEEPESGQRFLGMRIGASHARVAVEAWRRRPIPAFDVGEWVLQASLHAQAGAMEIGSLAVRLGKEKQGIGVNFLGELVSLWNQAAKTGELETRSLCLLHAALLQGSPDQASNLRLGLEACVARRDGQSWLAVLASTREPGLKFAKRDYLAEDPDLLNLIRVADFHVAPGRARQFMGMFSTYSDIYAAIGNRFLEADLNHPKTYKLLESLIAANPRDEMVRERASDWIESNLGHPQVYQLLVPLVAANPGDEAVLKKMNYWIESNLVHSQVPWLLSTLVAANPGNVAVRKRAADWIESSQGHPRIYQLLATLVAANPGDLAVRKRATDWIESSQGHPQIYQLLATLVAANPGDVAVRKRATDWIKSNQSHLLVYWLLAALVAARPEDESVRDLATSWIDSNLDHPQAYKVLETLVAARPEDESVRERATGWVKLNQGHPQVFAVLAPLVAASPDDEPVRDLATSWIDSNLDHPQGYKVLETLVAARPEDESVRKLATNWIKLNQSHPQVFTVLAPLVVANPEDEEIRRWATHWIKSNFERPQASHLLSTLIARSDGAEEFLKLGEKFLANPLRPGRAGILGVLLTGGKASSQYIDLALDYLMDEADLKARNFVLRQLSKAAATSLSAVLAYVAGCADEMRKKTVLRSIAVGIQRRPQALGALLDGRMEILSFEDTNALMVRLLDQEVIAEELLRFIAIRLADCFRKRGYGFLLRAVQRNPAAREGALALPDLDSRVRFDLSASGGG